ncbi:flocculation protein FLO11 [Ceratina calcarata]|uniref:Flocculation protein FLO11 n=1 Tax=Ceratina calcarata TaxID=156304 RepID=A0AAJ7SB65_9HYME|nr:flocculation protein FLO11 [Ceratina calcarata]
MEPIRGATWLVLLAVGCTALPPQSQTLTKGNDKMKQTKVPLFFNENESNELSAITSDKDSNGANGVGTTATSSVDVGANDTASKSSSRFGVSTAINATTAPSSSSSSVTSTPSMSPDKSHQTLELPSTSSYLPVPTVGDARTESGSSTTSSRGIGTTSRTTPKTSTTLATNASSPNTGSSATPTETSSRTIASDQNNASTFLSSSKKSTTSFVEVTTTPAPVSSKETRESTAKIRPQIKLTTNYTNLSETGVRLPEGASAALAKPTKYHYYPHNQHIYLLPECAVQQVCNAVYVRLNFTQPLCACPGRYRDPCSASLDSDDLHTTELVTDPRTKALTLVKTCEPVAEMRECRTPRDWSLLALQNVRTGKSHYLVICRCPDANILEGPMSHDQPTYASVPGIRVYGMMCVQGNRRGRPLRYTRSLSDYAELGTGDDSKVTPNDRSRFPWYKVKQLMDTAVWD